MNLSEFLAELADLDAELWVDGEQLRMRASKGRLTPDLHNELVKNKAEILVLLHQRNRSASVTSIPLAPVPRNEHLSLSFAQERLWFLDHLKGPSAVYNIPAGLHLRGPLDVVALKCGLGEIVQRHEVLRTTFPTVEGVPVQMITPVLEVGLPMVDLGGLSAEAREAELRRLAAEEARRPFNLARGLLLRVCLLKLEEEAHGLLLTLHHIVADGWSREVLVRELSALYQAFSMGAPSPLAALPIQYADYAQWQRRWLSGGVLEGQLEYWREQLAGAPALLELPTDYPRPAVQSFRGATEAFELDEELTQGLKALSQWAGVTLFMTLLGAFMVLLARYSRQEDIVVGSPIANRTHSQTEGLIGFFVNTLVLRADLSGDPPFEELLRRVRRVALEAYAHQEVPFERVVEALQPGRNLSHSPLFQVMFRLQNTPLGDLLGDLELPGLSLSPLALENLTAKFDLTLVMSETESRLQGEWEYSTDLFEAATIERLGAHFQTLLEGIVADPKQRLSELPLLPEAEWQQVVVEWNATEAQYPKKHCIHQLVEAQVEQAPEAVAVVFEDEWLTYRALNARANQLAHHLQALGVGPEGRVGVCMERSLELVMGLLGVLKAGGAYVPLDPTYPPEWLAFMLEDAQVAVLLTQARLAPTLPQTTAQVLCLDSAGERLSQAPEDNPGSGVSPANLAYVIYTSGSTGRPKGVQIAHQSLVNFVHSIRQRPGLTRQDILLAVTTLSFDIAALELYLPLVVGAQLGLVSREVAADGVQLGESLKWAGATVMQATPATWRLLLAAGWEGRQGLKILCGGEALPRELAHHLLERGASVWNLYGPTETTIWSAARQVSGPPNTSSPEAYESIGCPLANTQVYVLDRHLEPVPIGVPGELYIGGAGVARGYLHRLDTTAERFLPDPFGGEPGGRLYRTGDLVRYLPEGSLEFLGRLDHQVKVRGFRIELGEIEAVLGGHPGVREVVVLAREDSPGEKRLVAYVVGKEGPAPSGSELRGFVRERLPEYMVPSAFVGLPALPLTPNGKVDRQALPAPDGTRPELDAAHVMPQNELERTIAAVWQSVLGMTKVGIHDNFFELGGHSLMLARVYSQLQEIFSRDFSLVELYRYPTISTLAEYFTHEPGQQPSFQQSHARAEKQKEAIKRQKPKVSRESRQQRTN